MASFKTDGKMIFAIFLGAIITVVFLSSIADEVFSQTNSVTLNNASVTSPAVNATTELEGRELQGDIIILNTTNGDISSTYVRDERLGSNGLLTVGITANDTSVNTGETVNVSYTALPDGHAVGTGDRNVILLITLMGALAIAVFVIVMVMSGGSLRNLMRLGR